MRILIVDNNREVHDYGSGSIVHWIRELAPPGSVIHVRRAPDLDLPDSPSAFDRIIISGSAWSCLDGSEWTELLDQFLVRTMELDVPLLGICYGHQALARAIEKRARKNPQLRRAEKPEFGWIKVTKIASSPIFSGLDQEEFITFASHYEEVAVLPTGTKLLAQSHDCAIQAFEVEKRLAFGIQFHPEYNVVEGELSLQEKNDLEHRAWLHEVGRGKEVYDDRVARVIFGNFINELKNK